MKELLWLKAIREGRALSQRALAKASGVSHDTIGQIERGERKARPSTARKLAEALDVVPPLLEGPKPEITHSPEIPVDWLWQFVRGDPSYDELPYSDTYATTLGTVRMKVGSYDLKEVTEGVQLAARNAQQIMMSIPREIHDYQNLRSKFAEDRKAASRLEQLREFIIERSSLAIETVQDLVDLHRQGLDRLEQEIPVMRKEGERLEALKERIRPLKLPKGGSERPKRQL